MSLMYKRDSLLQQSRTETEYTIALPISAETSLPSPRGSQAVPRPLLYLWYIQLEFNGWNDFEAFPVEPIFTLCEYKLQPFSKEFSLVIS